MNQIESVRKLARSVGDFIRYWGFRKIHGEIWLVLYITKRAHSGAELTKVLEVSKALVSPALKELLAEGLIVEAPSENSKVKRYEAVEDGEAVIKQVLLRREQPLISASATALTSLRAIPDPNSLIDPQRAAVVDRMITTAQAALAFLVGTPNIWDVE